MVLLRGPNVGLHAPSWHVPEVVVERRPRNGLDPLQLPRRSSVKFANEDVDEQERDERGGEDGDGNADEYDDADLENWGGLIR